MGKTRFAVVLTESARSDLDEIDAYWTSRGESWRGRKYIRDLYRAARSELGDPPTARRGRWVRDCDLDGVREILVFGVYRIIYEIDEPAACVSVLSFWHAHRNAPPLE